MPSRCAPALAAVLCAAVLWPATVWAAPCSISTVPVGFPEYDPLTFGPTDGSGTISYSCNEKWVVRIELSPGGGNACVPWRTMTGPGDTLLYNLYLDPTRQTVWGNGSASTSAWTRPANGGKSGTVTIYARIPPRQDVAVGAYSDSVTVTVMF
jgi:spore coat protein U-like protein